VQYENSARSLKSVILLICYLIFVFILHFVFTAHNLIIIGLILTVLPLAFDIGRNKKSGFKISNKELIWFSGNFKGQIFLSDISNVEFKKRLDLSHRIRVIDKNNNKTLLPAEALPRTSTLKKILKNYKITVVDKKFN